MVVKASPSGILDDEITALSLQLDELLVREQTKKGKYNEANVPDVEMAFENYQVELQLHLQYWEDLKLAHSMADAVNADAETIAELMLAETKAHEDRQFALRMSEREPDPGTPSIQLETPVDSFEHDDLFDRLSTVHGLTDDEEADVVPGPSGSYIRDQTAVLGKLASKAFQCTACTDNFRYADVIRLQCGDEYCGDCLKGFIMRGVVDHDLALLPPRCCGTPVHPDVISQALSEEEIVSLRDAEVEKATEHKVYCSNESCGKFIPPDSVVADKATCRRCTAVTCAICRSGAHEGDCPADPALQATLALGTENRWQRCFSCHALVSIDLGCNHMT